MKKVDNKNIVIGNKLKQLRISKGYTQLKIAEILGVSPQHYGTLERGVNAFLLENILILCDFYNITIGSIFSGIKQEERKGKKESEKIEDQIDELNEEHKDVIIHLIKYYRQLEKNQINSKD